MPRHFEVDAQRREVVSEKIVEVARDAQAFRRARIHLEELRRDVELRVRFRELLARVRLADRNAYGEEAEELESEVAEKSGKRAFSFIDGDGDGERLRDDPRDRNVERVIRKLRRDDDHQHRLESGGLEIAAR